MKNELPNPSDRPGVIGSGPTHTLSIHSYRIRGYIKSVLRSPYLYAALFCIVLLVMGGHVAFSWLAKVQTINSTNDTATSTVPTVEIREKTTASNNENSVRSNPASPTKDTEHNTLVEPESDNLSNEPQIAPSSTPPNPQSIYWGATNRAGIAEIENKVGKRTAIFNLFTPWRNGSDFPTAWATNVRNRGTIPMLSWNPIDENGNGYKLKDIINGKHDAYITKWAQAARKWNQPLFLRTMHEANGSWYPWSIRANGTDTYIAAWRHIHDIFTRVGANQVTWIWCPNVQMDGYPKLASFYPGDQYVDWLGLDGYNANQDAYRSFSSIFKNSYNEINQITNKPLMIAETNSVIGSGSQTRAAFFTDVLQTQLPKNYPRIKAYLIFMNQEKYQFNDNATIQAFSRGISSSYYAANSFPNIRGKITPL